MLRKFLRTIAIRSFALVAVFGAAGAGSGCQNAVSEHGRT